VTRTEHFNYIGNITRLMDEITAELKPGKRWSYWAPLIRAARMEHQRNEAAFEDQIRELENAVELLEELGPEHALEFRRRTYPTLYPRPEESEVGTLGIALVNSTRGR